MKLGLSTNHWQKLYGSAVATGKIKVVPEDFIVEEVLGFEPTGTGEHLALYIQKTNLNTAFVAEQLAKYSGIPLRDISYAGRKDKFAVTRQWFTLNDRNQKCIDWNDLPLPGVKILNSTRHLKKIKIGSHKANRFKIKVCDLEVSSDELVTERLNKIDQGGFINYFGQQRFGEMITETGIQLNGNLVLAEKMIAGETIKNRNKRNIVVSALRSWLFNEIVSNRLEQNIFRTVLNGDPLILTGSNSYFISQEQDIEQNQQRLETRDIQISAPLWGTGELPSKYQALQFEQSTVVGFEKIINLLNEIGLAHQRRPILEYVRNFSFHFAPNMLELEFELAKGSYATSVLSEFLQIKQ